MKTAENTHVRYAERPVESGPTTVLLADDHKLFRVGLAALLDREPDLRVVGEVERGEDVMRYVRRTAPRVAVLEPRLPGLDGISAALQIRRAAPVTAVLLLAGVFRPQDLRRAVSAGVLGFLGKDAAPRTLIAAIHTVGGGRRAVDPALERAAYTENMAPSARETSILELVADGHSNKEIAATLQLSAGTVRNYISSMICRTQARNRVDVVRIARGYGWL